MRQMKAVVFLLLIGVGGMSAIPRVDAQLPEKASMLEERAFQGTVKRFIEEELTIFPERATALGDHRFDARVDDDSAAGIARIVSHAHRWNKIFRAFDDNSLSPNSEADREWLLANIDGELLRTESLRSYERDPGMYLPTRAVNELIKRNFAPAEVRMRSVTAREKAALANLGAARANLRAERVPQVAIDIVLQQMPSTLKFFRTSLPQAFDKVPDGPDKKALRSANSQVISAINDYGEWLRTTLRPSARGNYAIGADAFRRMIYDEDMVDTPLDKLEQIGETELRRLQDQFAATARLIDAKHSAAEVASALGRDHPAANQVISSVTAGLGSVRAFVVSHDVVRIPSAVEPIVAETPPYMRATTFASMDSPAPSREPLKPIFTLHCPIQRGPRKSRSSCSHSIRRPPSPTLQSMRYIPAIMYNFSSIA
jgi:uncharacterized protein (DUF885 family)